MACFCISFLQFYIHTFTPVLIPGVQQAHLLRLVNSNPPFLESVKHQLRILNDKPQVVYMNRNEFDDEDGDHIFEALVVLAQPEH
jgi:hypothetical protein